MFLEYIRILLTKTRKKFEVSDNQADPETAELKEKKDTSVSWEAYSEF